MRIQTHTPLFMGFNLQTQQRRHSPPNLWHRTRTNLRLSFIKHDQTLLLKIKAISNCPACKRELIPKPTRDANPGTLAQVFNVLAGFGFPSPEKIVIPLLDVERIAAELVGQDPGDFCGSRGFDEFGLGVRWCEDAHGYYEGVLALEGGHKAGLVGVVDFFDNYAGGERVGAVSAGYGGHSVFSGFEKFFYDELSYVTTCLRECQSCKEYDCEGGNLFQAICLLTPTIATFSM